MSDGVGVCDESLNWLNVTKEYVIFQIKSITDDDADIVKVSLW